MPERRFKDGRRVTGLVLKRLWYYAQFLCSSLWLWLEGIQLKPEANNKLYFLLIQYFFLKWSGLFGVLQAVQA